jgi:hypothetical protein
MTNNDPKHFSELTEAEIDEMWNECVNAVVDYAQKISMTGLSQGGSFDVYTALEKAIRQEWLKARGEKQ